MAATRETRETFPSIHVGGGFVHELGTPWSEYMWEAFKTWATEEAASKDLIIYTHGPTSVVWLDRKRRYHREDGPAIIKMDGYMAWYNHGDPHRYYE